MRISLSGSFDAVELEQEEARAVRAFVSSFVAAFEGFFISSRRVVDSSPRLKEKIPNSTPRSVSQHQKVII